MERHKMKRLDTYKSKISELKSKPRYIIYPYFGLNRKNTYEKEDSLQSYHASSNWKKISNIKETVKKSNTF